MIIHIKNILRAAMLVACGLTLLACGTTPNPNLYVLEPMQKLSASHVTEGAAEGLTYLVGPIVIAETLNRPEIVNRDEQYRVHVDPLERWAQPLDEGISSTLAENLRILLHTDRVVVYPWSFTNIADYVVRASILDFGPTSANQVTLNVSWMIGDGQGKVLVLKRVNYTGARNNDSNAATVAAMSAALEDMSRDIAEALKPLTPESE
jgi:uncharacterized lipoprotein YmbA